MYTFGSAASNVTQGNTITISPATGALVIVFSITSGGGGTPTVVFSDNSSSTWANASNNVAVSGLHYSVGYCLSADAGVTTITATYNGGTPGSCDLVAITYTGMSSPSFVAITAPNNQVAPGTTANALTAGALACGAVNALMVGMSANFSAHGNIVAGTGFTARFSNNSGNQDFIVLEDPAIEVTGSNTATFTDATHGGTDTYASLAVAFADNSVPPNSATIAWVS